MEYQKILQKIVSRIETDLSDFDKSIGSVQGKIYSELIEFSKDLEIKNGQITNVVKNQAILRKMLSKIKVILDSDQYRNEVTKIQKAFDVVESMQNNYFSSLTTSFSPKKAFEAVKTSAVDYTVGRLTDQGVSTVFTFEMEDILRQNISSGGSLADFTDQIRNYVKGGVAPDGTKIPGRLQRYAGQIATDSLNQFAANYNEAITSDLNWKWRMYTGSLIETSRPWCVHMVDKKYVHESELETVISDNIDGVKICSEAIPCSKKTGLPSGMIAGTNAKNISQRRGGWQCGHQFGGVPDEVVPKNLRDAIKAKTQS